MVLCNSCHVQLADRRCECTPRLCYDCCVADAPHTCTHHFLQMPPHLQAKRKATKRGTAASRSRKTSSTQPSSHPPPSSNPLTSLSSYLNRAWSALSQWLPLIHSEPQQTRRSTATTPPARSKQQRKAQTEKGGGGKKRKRTGEEGERMGEAEGEVESGEMRSRKVRRRAGTEKTSSKASGSTKRSSKRIAKQSMEQRGLKKKRQPTNAELKDAVKKVMEEEHKRMTKHV